MVALTVSVLAAQQPPPRAAEQPQPKAAAPDPWRAPAANKAAQELGLSNYQEFFEAHLFKATAGSLPKDGFLFPPMQKVDFGEQGRETRVPIQIKPDLQWLQLRAFLVGVEREGLPWRLRRLQCKAAADSVPWADETPFPKTLHIEQLEFARRQIGKGSTDLPVGTAVLRGLQELSRAAAMVDVVVGELTLTTSTPQEPGNLQLVLWLQGKAAAAQVTRLCRELKQAAAAATSPFAKVESLQGPTPREGIDGGSVVSLSIALQPMQ